MVGIAGPCSRFCLALHLAKLPPVETESLRLNRMEPADAEAVRALTDGSAITGAVDFLPDPFTLANARQLIGPAKVTKDCFLGAKRPDGTLDGHPHHAGARRSRRWRWATGSANAVTRSRADRASKRSPLLLGLLRQRIRQGFDRRRVRRSESAASVGLTQEGRDPRHRRRRPSAGNPAKLHVRAGLTSDSTVD